MTRNDIIDELARKRTIEGLIRNIKNTEAAHNLQDLAEDLYLELLEKNEDLIVRMYNNNQLGFFIVRMIMNNIFSKNSRYYYRYKRMQIDENKTNEDYDDETEE